MEMLRKLVLMFQILLTIHLLHGLKKPVDLELEDYNLFMKIIYPFTEEPLFHIHLNVDYPFNLTGILYFPKLKNQIELQKNKFSV